MAIASGTTAGWTVASTFGNVGVVAGGTAFGLRALPIMGAGAVAGAAAYGAYRGLSEGDPVAFSSLGLGAAAGAGVSAGIGGVGIVGGFGGCGTGSRGHDNDGRCRWLGSLWHRQDAELWPEGIGI
ncbi:MAG: hypothetical protein HC824_00600 [Synechococcales cyanobacterium RM1_1_8]|nr:hypothetical protein [Synechococcales cyanobacterium RM1_1_8]